MVMADPFFLAVIVCIAGLVTSITIALFVTEEKLSVGAVVESKALP